MGDDIDDDDNNSIDSTKSFIDQLREKSIEELLVEYTVCLDAEKHLGDYKVVLKEKFNNFCTDYKDFLVRREEILANIRKTRYPEYEAKVEQHFTNYPKVEITFFFLSMYLSLLRHRTRN